jgi:hypothetical protein
MEITRLEGSETGEALAGRVLEGLVEALGAAAGIVGLEVDGRFATVGDVGATDRLTGLAGRRVEDFRAWQRFQAG